MVLFKRPSGWRLCLGTKADQTPEREPVHRKTPKSCHCNLFTIVMTCFHRLRQNFLIKFFHSIVIGLGSKFQSSSNVIFVFQDGFARIKLDQDRLPIIGNDTMFRKISFRENLFGTRVYQMYFTKCKGVFLQVTNL